MLRGQCRDQGQNSLGGGWPGERWATMPPTRVEPKIECLCGWGFGFVCPVIVDNVELKSNQTLGRSAIQLSLSRPASSNLFEIPAVARLRDLDTDRPVVHSRQFRPGPGPKSIPSARTGCGQGQDPNCTESELETGTGCTQHGIITGRQIGRPAPQPCLRDFGLQMPFILLGPCPGAQD